MLKDKISENYIKKVKNKNVKSYCYEITNPDEYKNLKELINNALQECISKIQHAITPITNHSKVARSTKTKSTT